MLKMNLIANNLFDRESLTGSLMRHRYSAISGISSIKGSPKAIRGWLRRFHQASPASPFQSPDSKKESKTKETSGLKRGIPLASFDLDTSSWRMSQVSLLPLNRLYTDCYGLDKYGGLRDLKLSELPMPDEFRATWPKWGMTVNGELWPLKMSVRHISGTDGGLWPTPVGQDDGKTPEAHMRMKARMKGGPRKKPTSLTVMIKGVEKQLWPTPRNRMTGAVTPCQSTDKFNNLESVMARRIWRTPNSHIIDHKKSVKKLSGRKPSDPQVGLADQVIWPTPQERDYKDRGEQTNYQKVAKKLKLAGIVGGQLNPDWVEWLMGWPLFWTSPKPLKEVLWLSWDIDPAEMEDDSFIPRVATGIKDSVNRLKALGNGQVPLCTATAWEILNGH